MNCPKKTHKGDFAKSKGDGPDQVHLHQMVLGTLRRETGHHERWPKELKSKLTQVGHQGRSTHQMVLMMARREAGSPERQPKTLKGELENNSRSHETQSENRHGVRVR